MATAKSTEVLSLSTAGGVTFSVWGDRFDGDRDWYYWEISNSLDGEVLMESGESHRISTAPGDFTNLGGILGTLFSFLATWAEAHESGRPDSEARDMFPASLGSKVLLDNYSSDDFFALQTVLMGCKH